MVKEVKQNASAAATTPVAQTTQPLGPGAAKGMVPLLKEHTAFMSVLEARLVKLRTARRVAKLGLEDTVGHLVKDGDVALTVDVLPALASALEAPNAPPVSAVVLGDILSLLLRLLESPYEEYVRD